MNIQDYYTDAELYEPPFFDKREFGIIKKGQKMWRHISFTNVQKLRSFLIEHRPIHVYFSTAKYEDPSNPDMEKKKEGWLGSDLIFDIDNDHLETPTLAEAAFQAMKLKDILIDKFGFKDMMMTFSGSRGYHIHVRDECIQNLNNHERQQIADYIWKWGVDIDAPVTSDKARLIRLPGSIHGKTLQPCRIIKIA